MPDNKPPTCKLTATISKTLHKRVAIYAAEHEVLIKHIVSDALHEFLAQKEKGQTNGIC